MTNEETPRGIPEGWVKQSFPETYSAQVGPFWFRDFSSKEPGVGFLAEPRHMNAGGIVHGGALLTLADMALWDICRRVIGPFRAVTVSVNADFLAPGAIGKFIMANGEPVKIGKSLLFARGLVTSDGETLMNFSGTLKRLTPRRDG